MSSRCECFLFPQQFGNILCCVTSPVHSPQANILSTAFYYFYYCIISVYQWLKCFTFELLPYGLILHLTTVLRSLVQQDQWVTQPYTTSSFSEIAQGSQTGISRNWWPGWVRSTGCLWRGKTYEKNMRTGLRNQVIAELEKRPKMINGQEHALHPEL